MVKKEDIIRLSYEQAWQIVELLKRGSDDDNALKKELRLGINSLYNTLMKLPNKGR